MNHQQILKIVLPVSLVIAAMLPWAGAAKEWKGGCYENGDFTKECGVEGGATNLGIVVYRDGLYLLSIRVEERFLKQPPHSFRLEFSVDGRRVAAVKVMSDKYCSVSKRNGFSCDLYHPELADKLIRAYRVGRKAEIWVKAGRSTGGAEIENREFSLTGFKGAYMDADFLPAMEY